MKKRDEKWEREKDKLKENTESELKQVSEFNSENNNHDDTGKCSKNNNCVNTSDNYNGEMTTHNNQVVDNKVSNGVNYNDEYNSCLLYTSRCV